MLVWNGEHYNLGNVLGIQPNRASNYMQENYLGIREQAPEPAKELHQNLTRYLDECEAQGYAFDFIIASVSGVFSDNAPPSLEILQVIQEYNKRYGEETVVKMVSLTELYEEIKARLYDAPVCHGDLTDWWANGVGSTPYTVKHYREAQNRYHLCQRLDANVGEHYPELWKCAQDNLMLYAEHTWGHSSTITNPYDTMVLNLDLRKTSYASKAHEAVSQILVRIMKEKGDILRYYNTDGVMKACNVTELEGLRLVEYYIETQNLPAAQVTDETGKALLCQVSPHPRGRKVSFIDWFKAGEKKIYFYKRVEACTESMNTRKCYVGAERVRDIVNDYETESYHLPYYYENAYFRLSYQLNQGVTSFVDRRTGRELTGQGDTPFFTPMYQRTKIRPGKENCVEEAERRSMGRNIRGNHAEMFIGELEDVVCEEKGPVFTVLRLRYRMEGSVHTDMVLKFYEEIPRIDFTLELGKSLSSDIESIFLPMSLSFDQSTLYLRKGTEAFRPGIDQIPGTCMEFYMSEQELVWTSPKGGAMIAARDTPLFYMGEMRHHPIVLCDGREENNRRPVYSWIMNNNWETNFKMDLAGYCEFRYSLWLCEENDAEQAMDLLKEQIFDPQVLMTG